MFPNYELSQIEREYHDRKEQLARIDAAITNTDENLPQPEGLLHYRMQRRIEVQCRLSDLEHQLKMSYYTTVETQRILSTNGIEASLDGFNVIMPVNELPNTTIWTR